MDYFSYLIYLFRDIDRKLERSMKYLHFYENSWSKDWTKFYPVLLNKRIKTIFKLFFE